MTAKLVAVFGVLAAHLLVLVGMYWFAFGLWPRSWVWLVVFDMARLGVGVVSEGVKRDI